VLAQTNQTGEQTLTSLPGGVNPVRFHPASVARTRFQLSVSHVERQGATGTSNPVRSNENAAL
jgi:hypothetical protein